MTIAAAMERRTVRPRSQASRIAGVDVLGDLEEAEPLWRALEDTGHLSTPYQRYDLLAPWQRAVGQREGYRPFIVIARDAERRPLALLPLAVRQEFGIAVATFMGGKHTSFNMGLWDGAFAVKATDADLGALLSGLRAHGEADVLAFTQQPLSWRDAPNPLAMLPGQPSINGCPVLLMTPGAAPASRIGNSMRRRLKNKERKLLALPGYRHFLARSDADIVRLLDWFFRIKPMRMSEQKLPNVFADPGLEEFIRTACLARRGEERIIDIHALECDDEVIAIYAGVADGQRFSMMFNTYTMSDNARYSPGLILIRNIVDHYATRGYRAVDLGSGTDEYKRLFCKDDEPIFDSFIPLTAPGRIAAAAIAALSRGKRLLKQDKTLFGLAQRLRGAFNQ